MNSKRQKPAGRAQSFVLEGRVRDVTDAGDAVIETERGIVLARGGLPDEQVRVRATQARAGVLRGELMAILTPSVDRLEPVCEIAERCGGCPLLSLSLPAQHALKLRRVQRALAGVCDDDVAVQLEAADEPLAYRRRARLGFRRVGGQLVLGYHQHGSHQLIDVAHCHVLTPALSTALALLRAKLGPVIVGSGTVALDGLDTARVAVALRCDENQAQAVYRCAEELATSAPIVSVTLGIADGTPALFGESLATRPGPDGLALTTPHHGFSQVNAAVNSRLSARVLELAEPDAVRVLELYAGHGNFTLALAARAAHVLAVEGDAPAVEACRENLRTRGHKQAKVQLADVRQLSLRERYDVLVLDPPRAGCDTLAAVVAQARPERVVYISCHMTTLQRDLRALAQAGYRADRVHALDMFPQTGHVEAVVRMRKSAS